MLSSKPYLFRALYDWILDSHCTPYMIVDAFRPGVEVPSQYIKNGQIVLNVSPGAVVGFSMEHESISFNARFGGVPLNVHVPMQAVIGIYARENGQGMMFEPESDQLPPDASGSRASVGKPSLRVVK